MDKRTIVVDKLYNLAHTLLKTALEKKLPWIPSFGEQLLVLESHKYWSLLHCYKLDLNDRLIKKGFYLVYADAKVLIFGFGGFTKKHVISSLAGRSVSALHHHSPSSGPATSA